MLAMLRRCLGHASAALRGELRGGPLGQLRLSVRETAFEGALHFSRIISPPAMKAYALLTTVLPNGCVQLQLSLPDATGAASEPLLTVKLGETRLVLLAGKAEVLYLSLVRMNHAASAPPPSAPSLPPLHLGAAVAAGSAEAAEAAAERGDAAAVAASHSSSPKRAADAPPLATPPCRLVVLYENQRRLTMLRTYTASDLLPLDPGRFSDEAMKACLPTAHYNKLEDFPLPSAAGSAAGWEWCGDWHIDFEGGGKADDGWQYAFNWNTGWLSASNPITHVRRRRWVRQAMWTGDPFAVPTLDIAPTAEGKAEGGAVGGAMMAAALMTAGAAAVKSAAQVTCNGLSSSASRGGGRGGSKMEGFGSGSARGRGAVRDATPPAEAAGGAARGAHTPPAAPAVESFASPASSGVERHLAEDILGLARAATALQMTMADGARMRVHVEEVELSSIVSKLVEHGTELLQELLESHPWYKDPLQKATQRIHQHLGSDQLSIEVSISVSAVGSTSRGSSVSVESASGVSETCATFHNEINLMDFVADVQEIYRAFTGTLTSQNSTFAFGLRKVATMTR
ncbi:hypothetical protein AB1Y20_009590 [Prymnesium parvum]|uniref:TECPR1-like DysF domain-containing protein n=1 Tax=Prymnesium parvum TaxID=97485 RepID=A0AB34K4C2_PRYPA